MDINSNESKPGSVEPVGEETGQEISERLKAQHEPARVLTVRDKYSYGVGHVFNDLCASMWFSYLLIFFEKVLLFPGDVAGLLLLVGQLADGISTPLVGIFSDKQNKIPFCARYGRRKIWHLIGTFCVAISFPFIFSPAYGLQDSGMVAQSIYYCFFVVIFQFGWASVQISHLALIPDLTPKKSQRTELNSIRYAFTVLANLTVYTMTFFLLEANTSSSTEAPPLISAKSISYTSSSYANDSCNSEDTALQPTDLYTFRIISLACVVVGCVFSVIFHLGVREPLYNSPKTDGRRRTRMKKLDWFKLAPFYLVAVLYMATRLYVNLYQVYIPLFLQDTLCMAKSAVATIPFTMYLAGFFCSIIMKQFNKVVGRKGTFATGCLVGLAGCTWVYFDGYPTHVNFVTWGIFGVAVLLGSGGSTLLITSLSITADLIGINVEGGAFVYGLMSLVDKFSNGIIIMVIQESYTGESSYYRNVIFFMCGGACVVGLLATLALVPVNIGKRRGPTNSVLSILSGESISDDEESSVGRDNPVHTISGQEEGVCSKAAL